MPTRFVLRRAILLTIAFFALLGTSTVKSSTSHITVNTTSDAADFGGSQQVGDLPGPDGLVSLREAIIAANNTAGPQVIGFNIPTSDPGFNGTVFTILPFSGLPALSDSGTTIDGATQVGFTGNTNSAGPEIVLNGSLPTVVGPGIVIFSSGNTVRELVIQSFPDHGIFIIGPQAIGNVVAGCFIGVEAGGTANAGNGRDGVNIDSASGNIVGGTDTAARNIISGNARSGVFLVGSFSIAEHNLVQNNFIGMDASGTVALGNLERGVSIVSNTGTNARNSQIIGNLISANSEEGVGIFSSDGNLIKGNLIGTDINGNASFGNGNPGGRGIGVGIGGGPGSPVSNGNRVEDNLIADNSLSGVVVSGGVSNSINRNRIFSNGGLGIQLGPGLKPNDSGDFDTGPNELMNFPVLDSARATPGQLIVRGTIDTQNSGDVRIELFANPMPTPGGDPSGHGEGAVFLGVARANPDGRFTATLPPVTVGTLITATATDAFGNTSEFALNIAAISP